MPASYICESPERRGGATEATPPYLLAGAEHFENVRRRVGVCSILHGLCRELKKKNLRSSTWESMASTTAMT